MPFAQPTNATLVSKVPQIVWSNRRFAEKQWVPLRGRLGSSIEVTCNTGY